MIDFLKKRALAQNKEQVIIDRVYKDEEKLSYVFKPKNLISFLYHHKQFKNFSVVEIYTRLKELGGQSIRFRINPNTTIRAWRLPFDTLNKFLEEKVIEDLKIEFKEKYEDEAF